MPIWPYLIRHSSHHVQNAKTSIRPSISSIAHILSLHAASRRRNHPDRSIDRHVCSSTTCHLDKSHACSPCHVYTRTQTYAACARKGKDCVGWVDKYFNDCLCGSKDDVSFVLGMVSLLFWTVAEIPQIVTNFRNKSGHGVSFGLLFTWVIGDIFNLAGCMLEPATLPTQLYTALLYTTITTILVLQTLYYAYYCKYGGLQQQDRDRISKEDNSGDGRRQGSTFDRTSNPIPTTLHDPLITSSARRDMFYTSARSLASSETPPRGSPFFQVKSAPAAPPIILQGSSSSDEEEEEEEEEDDDRTLIPPRLSTSSRMRRVPRSVGYGGTLLAAAAASLPSRTNALMKGQMLLLGRRFLQEKEQESKTIGLWLGWMMAAIYMGGRLPQILLNIKRGSAEGVNPLMFLFALIANVTYVGSILVRSVEWRRTKPNVPWLFDAIVCVLLDLFILMQYAYYKFNHRARQSHEGENYYEAPKPLLLD